MSKYIEYYHDDYLLEGFLALPEKFDNSLRYPIVFVVHTWCGRDDFVISKAKELAELGYIAFAVDLYGKNILGSSVDENTKLMQPFLDNRNLINLRFSAAIEAMKKLPYIDSSKMAAIGYCFGGLCVLDMAVTSTVLQGVVSIHGLLQLREIGLINKIATEILILHGDKDPMSSQEMLVKFQKEIDSRLATWQVNIYSGARHAFTNPNANDESLGTVYNKTVSEKSWSATVDYLRYLFNKQKPVN